MTRTLGNMLLWLASRAGRLGFKLSGEDVTDCVCYLSLGLTPEKQSARIEEILERAYVRATGSAYDKRVNTAPNRDTN